MVSTPQCTVMTTGGHDTETLEALTKRGELLERLCDGPVPKPTLVEEFDLSRSTLDRAVRELEELNLVERRESKVRVTYAGRLAVDTLETCQSTLGDIEAAEAVLDPLPLDAPLPREAVAGSEARLAAEPVPYEALEPVHDALGDARQYRALLPALDDPRQLRLLYEHVVTQERPAELIVTPELFDTLREQFPRRLATMADQVGFGLRVSETVPPFALACIDGSDGVTVAVVVFAESGAVHGTLINDTHPAVRWARDLIDDAEAGATDRTEELRGAGDGSLPDDTGNLPSGSESLPLSLETEGFVRLGTAYFQETPVPDPATVWRTGLSLPEVHVGYAVERALPADRTTSGPGARSIAEALSDELAGGADCVVVGLPGSGKSTVCKQVACEWHDDRGSVLYREQGRGRPFQSVETLVDAVDADDGHTLVVVEDAVRPEASTVFETIDRCSDREDVSFLLDARESEWHDPSADRVDVTALSVTHMPALEEGDLERLVDHFERTVGTSIDVPLDRLRQEIHEETAGGGDTPLGELLLLLHRLATYADPLSDGRTSLEDAVASLYDDIAPGGRDGTSTGVEPTAAADGDASDETVLDVCVLANVLNAAGLGVDGGLLYAVADDGAYGAVDDAIDRLEGRVLFPRDDGSYRTVHEAWSTAFLAHLLDAEGESAASERFCRCVSRLLALADDPGECEVIADHLDDGRALRAIRDDPRRWADETVEAVYAMGRERPKLALLFGSDDGVALPDACSETTATERSVWLGRLFLASGHYDRAERTFDRLPDGEPELAVERLLGLAKVAIQRGAFEDARARAEECLAAVDAENRPRDRARASQTLGTALGELDEYEAGGEQFRDALDGFEAVGDRQRIAQTLIGLGRIARFQGNTDQARTYFRRSLSIAREIGDRHGQATSLNALGTLEMEVGEYHDAIGYYERSLDIRQALGSRQGEANALNNIGMVCNMLGRYDQALEYCERSRAIKEELGDRRGEANACSTLGIVAASKGDHERARQYFERSARITGDIGDRLGEAMAFNNLGNVACRQCEYDDAREYFERSLEMKRDIGARQGVVEPCINLGEVACRRGRYDRAREFLEEARDVARETDHQHRHAQSLDRLAEVARRRGAHDRARDLLGRALDLAEDIGDPGLLSKIHYRRGELALAAGDHDRAREALQRAADAVEEGGDTLDDARVRLARARVAFAEGELGSARERATAARDAYAELSAPHYEARSRRLLGRVAAESGDYDTARDRFEAALDTFEDVGAPQDVLVTLRHLLGDCRSADDDARAQWREHVRVCVADAPEATVDAHGGWVDQAVAAGAGETDGD